MESAKPDIHMIMFGHTGSGKSSTGNTIIGEKVFDSYTGPESQTKQFTQHSFQIKGRKVILADTPGFFDTRRANVQREIVKHLSNFKPNVFLFVITLANRFPQEAELTLDRIGEMLGQDVYRHSVVLFSAIDYLEGTPIPAFVTSYAHPKVRELVRKCGGRCVGFNNHAEGSERVDQVNELMAEIDKIGELKEYSISGLSPSAASGERWWSYRPTLSEILPRLTRMVHGVNMLLHDKFMDRPRIVQMR